MANAVAGCRPHHANAIAPVSLTIARNDIAMGWHSPTNSVTGGAIKPYSIKPVSQERVPFIVGANVVALYYSARNTNALNKDTVGGVGGDDVSVLRSGSTDHGAGGIFDGDAVAAIAHRAGSARV